MSQIMECRRSNFCGICTGSCIHDICGQTYVAEICEDAFLTSTETDDEVIEEGDAVVTMGFEAKGFYEEDQDPDHEDKES